MPRFNGVPDDQPLAAVAPAVKPRFAGVPDDAAPTKPHMAADVAKSAAVGVGEGMLGFGGMLGDVNALAGRGLGYILEKVAGGAPTSEQQEQIAAARRGPLALLNPSTSSDLRKPVEAVTGEFYEPQTKPGEYARTIGQFAPSAAIGGPGSIAARVAGDVIIPAVASETAGQFTKGTAAEPYARFAGGLGGNLAATGARAYANADNAVAARAAASVTEPQYAAAQQLQETGRRIDVPLSGPEAIQEATGGATKLADVQRVVEGSLSGGDRTAQFYARRPQQVDAATRAVLDIIFPASQNPSTLGPRAATAAQDAIDTQRRSINDATRPAYRAAEGHLIDEADFEPIARDPAFQASLRRMRADEVLGPTFEGQPDNSIAVIDAVTKDMRDRGVALGNAANPGFSSQKSGMFGTGATEARDIARDPTRGGVQAYDDALTMQAQARRDNLEPLEQGPLGRIAAAKTTQGAYGEILPQKPLAGGTDEIVATIQRLMGQDPDLPPALVRQSLGDAFDQSSRRIATGENQSVGGRFANTVAGTPEQADTVQAVLDAINRPGARVGMDELLEVLRATSQRRPMGSPTAPNQMINESLDQISLPTAVAMAPASAGSTLFGAVRDRVRLAARDRSHRQLAELFTAPDSVQQIRGLAAQGSGNPLAALFARQTIQTPAELKR